MAESPATGTRSDAGSAGQPYQRRPTRPEYLLNDRGRDLLPAMQEICRWTDKTGPDT